MKYNFRVKKKKANPSEDSLNTVELTPSYKKTMLGSGPD